VRPVRYAAIGCGRVFERIHLPALLAAPDVRLVAVYDADPARAAESAAAAGGDVAVAPSVAALLSSGVDAVSVCTPNDSHVGYVLDAVAAGAAVLCEKPLAHRLDDARRLAGSLPPGARVAVNLPYQLHPLNDLVAAALAGCTEATFTFTTPGARLWRPRTDWYGDAARAGGGALLDLGVHVLALLATLFGAPGEVRSCALRGGPPEDAATLSVRYGTATVEVTIDRTRPRFAMELRATTPAGEVTYDVRAGHATLPDGSRHTAELAIETAAVAAFARGDRAPGVATALAAEETAWAAYALAGA
jgi:predicted dehydrogenase